MGTLSADMLYPDCVHCGASGLIHVELSNRRRDIQPPLLCNRCGRQFAPERGCDWHGVFDLPEPHRTAYIDCEIRGLTRKAHGMAHGVTEEGAKQRVQDARKKMAP